MKLVIERGGHKVWFENSTGHSPTLLRIIQTAARRHGPSLRLSPPSAFMVHLVHHYTTTAGDTDT